MNLSLFFARRYLFSRKSHSAINIISGVSALGIAVSTMALVCVLSVFNGFRELIAGLYSAFDRKSSSCLFKQICRCQRPRSPAGKGGGRRGERFSEL